MAKNKDKIARAMVNNIKTENETNFKYNYISFMDNQVNKFNPFIGKDNVLHYYYSSQN